MANIKNKVKNFWEDHKKDILVVGGIAAASVGASVWAYKLYMGGFNYGVATGFNSTLDWLDQTFPEESKARELWEAYKQVHPEDVLYVTGTGKIIK